MVGGWYLGYWHCCSVCLDSEKVHFQTVINKASEMLRTKYNIVHSTVQVEDYQQVMGSCQVCQTVPSVGIRWLPCLSQNHHLLFLLPVCV